MAAFTDATYRAGQLDPENERGRALGRVLLGNAMSALDEVVARDDRLLRRAEAEPETGAVVVLVAVGQTSGDGVRDRDGD